MVQSPLTERHIASHAGWLSGMQQTAYGNAYRHARGYSGAHSAAYGKKYRYTRCNSDMHKTACGNAYRHARRRTCSAKFTAERNARASSVPLAAPPPCAAAAR